MQIQMLLEHTNVSLRTVMEQDKVDTQQVCLLRHIVYLPSSNTAMTSTHLWCVSVIVVYNYCSLQSAVTDCNTNCANLKGFKGW